MKQGIVNVCFMATKVSKWFRMNIHVRVIDVFESLASQRL